METVRYGFRLMCKPSRASIYNTLQRKTGREKDTMSEPNLKARIPTQETTRDELKMLVIQHDSASTYDELLNEFINEHAD